MVNVFTDLNTSPSTFLLQIYTHSTCQEALLIYTKRMPAFPLVLASRQRLLVPRLPPGDLKYSALGCLSSASLKQLEVSGNP